MREKLSRKAKYNNSNTELVISSNLLQALRDCSFSTLKGFIDKGNPRKLAHLATMKLVESKDGGYIVTEEGRAYLSSHKRELMKL